MKSLQSIVISFLIEVAIAIGMATTVIALIEVQQQGSPGLFWIIVQVLAGVLLMGAFYIRGRSLLLGMSLWGGTGVMWNVVFIGTNGNVIEETSLITPQSRLRTARLIEEYIEKRFPGRLVRYQMSQTTDIPAIAVKARSVAGTNREKVFGVYYGPSDGPNKDRAVLVLAPNQSTAEEAGVAWAKMLAKCGVKNVASTDMNFTGSITTLIPRPIREDPTK